MSEAAVYVRVNHKKLVTIDRKKTPKLFEFLSEHFENMLEVLAEDFKKMEFHMQANAKKENPEPYKAVCPVKYVSVKDYFELSSGLGEEKITSMVICFGITRLICDIRIERKEMIQKQMQSIADGSNKAIIGEFKFKPTIVN